MTILIDVEKYFEKREQSFLTTKQNTSTMTTTLQETPILYKITHLK